MSSTQFGRVAIGIVVSVSAFVAVVAAGAASGRTSGISPAERHDLLQRFMPVLYFHADEAWAPVAVERFLRVAPVERQTAPGTWTRTTALPTSTIGCASTPCYRFNLPCALTAGARCYERAAPTLSDWSHPTIYGRVLAVPTGTPLPAGIRVAARYLVRYWLFYSFDDWRSRGELWQAHEGDWEHVSIALDADLKPIFAAYSQHCSGTVRAWSNVKRVDTHPIDYVALGSHANYFEQTSSPTQFLRCVYKNVAKAERSKARRLVSAVQSGITDRTGTAHKVEPGAQQQPSPQLVDLDSGLPLWGRFQGRWSEGELLWVGRTPTRYTRVRSGRGPATPRRTATSIPALWHTDSS
jgi:hypothetical protein